MYWYFKWAQHWSDPGFFQNQRAGSLISNKYIPGKTGSIISKAWRGGNPSNFLNSLWWEQRICILEEKLEKMFLAISILSEKNHVFESEKWKIDHPNLRIFLCVCLLPSNESLSVKGIAYIEWTWSTLKYSKQTRLMWRSIFIVMISTAFWQNPSHRVVSPTWSGLSLRKTQTRLSKFSLAAGSFLLLSVMIWKISQKWFQRDAGKKWAGAA